MPDISPNFNVLNLLKSTEVKERHTENISYISVIMYQGVKDLHPANIQDKEVNCEVFKLFKFNNIKELHP